MIVPSFKVSEIDRFYKKKKRKEVKFTFLIIQKKNLHSSHPLQETVKHFHLKF